FARETNIPVTALRYDNVYGPRMRRNRPYTGVAALAADALAQGRPPRVFEDGARLRDFVHVRAVARGNVLSLTAPTLVPGPITVSSGTPRTVGELASALHTVVHPSAPPPAMTGEPRMGDVRPIFADPARAAPGLGFRAQEEFLFCISELAHRLAMAA